MRVFNIANVVLRNIYDYDLIVLVLVKSSIQRCWWEIVAIKRVWNNKQRFGCVFELSVWQHLNVWISLHDDFSGHVQRKYSTSKNEPVG